MSTSVYWIRHKDHTDMFSQGYIGVSKSIDRRWSDHEKGKTNSLHLKKAIKKYGWENLIKQVILVAEEKYCLNIEKQIRSKDKLGWNIVVGGGMPPNQKGKKRSQETRLKKSGKNHQYFEKGYLLEAKANPNFKGPITATNIKTGKQTVLNGAKQITMFGLTTSNVYACIKGKQMQHKGYTFKRDSACQ